MNLTTRHGAGLAAAALGAALGMAFFGTGARAEPGERSELACPSGDMKPLGRVFHMGDDLASAPLGLGAPFALMGYFLDFVFTDNLAKLPKTSAQVTVVGPDNKPIRDALVAFIHDSGSRFLAQAPSDGKPMILPVGDYSINVIHGGAKMMWGSRDVTLVEKKKNAVVIRADRTFPDALPSALRAPAPAGSTLLLDTFDGVMEKGVLAAVRGDTVVSQKAFRSAPSGIVVPPVPGKYMLRVIACAPAVSVAAWPLEVSAPTVALDASSTAPAGTALEVRWSGDGALGDKIGLRNKTSGEFIDGMHVIERSKTRVARLVMPFDSGDYEIVYRSVVDGTVLAARDLRVTPASLQIEAPSTMAAGMAKRFVWPSGPGNMSTLELVNAADGYRKSVLTKPGQNRFMLPPGNYTLRLMDGPKVRWQQPLTITPATLLDALPRQTAPSARLRIGAADDVQFFDAVVVVPRGTQSLRAHHLVSASNDRGSLELIVPNLPGQYDVLYIATDNPGTSVLLARTPLDIPAPAPGDLSFTAPEEIGPVQETLLSWANPDGKVVEIWRIENGRATRRVRTVESAGMQHLALAPGTYELRLVMADDDSSNQNPASAKKVLMRRPLTVRPDRIFAEAPTTVAPGVRFPVRISVKPAFSDRIVVTKAGEKNPVDEHFGIGASADSAMIDAPDEPGRYELVYLGAFESGSPDVVLERVPLLVK